MSQEKHKSSENDAEPNDDVDKAHVDPQWDCLYGLPRRCYLTFVGRFILHAETGITPDPFAIDLPADKADQTYISRKSIIDDICRPGTRIILGKPGIGKTTIFNRIWHDTESGLLSVGIPLQKASGRALDLEILSGEASFLTPVLLIPQMFDTFWAKTVCSCPQGRSMVSPSKRVEYLTQLRADRQWMELLRWFVRHYPPSCLEVEDFELAAWLRGSSQDESLSSELPPPRALRQLIRLITWKAPSHLFRGTQRALQAYRGVEVLLDGTGSLSPAAVRRLVADAQTLYDTYREEFSLKIFMSDSWQPQVLGMDCVQQGRVNVVNHLDWSDSEMRSLLRVRLHQFTPGSPTSDPETLPEYDLGDILADSGALERAARSRLESIIVSAAQGIPLHALRLARCIVAACAGCWPHEFELPLSIPEVQRIIQKYHEKAGKSWAAQDVASEHKEKGGIMKGSTEEE
jgi:hypothetical protein